MCPKFLKGVKTNGSKMKRKTKEEKANRQVVKISKDPIARLGETAEPLAKSQHKHFEQEMVKSLHFSCDRSIMVFCLRNI